MINMKFSYSSKITQKLLSSDAFHPASTWMPCWLWASHHNLWFLMPQTHLLVGFSIQGFPSWATLPLFYKDTVLKDTVTTHSHVGDFLRPTNPHKIGSWDGASRFNSSLLPQREHSPPSLCLPASPTGTHCLPYTVYSDLTHLCETIQFTEMAESIFRLLLGWLSTVLLH